MTLQRVMIMIVLTLACLLAACGSSPAQQTQAPAAPTSQAQPTTIPPTTQPQAQPTTVSPAALHKELGKTEAKPSAQPIERALDMPTPLMVRYANLEFTVSKAVISNLEPAFSNPTSVNRKYSADRAWAYVDLSIHNPLAHAVSQASVNFNGSLVTLQLAGGQPIDGEVIWPNFKAQATQKTQIVYKVPFAATWQGAQLMLSEAGREPASLPLDGPAVPSQYPQALNLGDEATVENVVYKPLGGSLDIDYDGKRAKTGERFVSLPIRVTNQRKSAASMPLSGSHFRLIADGVPLAPTKAPMEAVKSGSAKEGELVFIVPAGATKFELQVGDVESGKTTRLPIQLTAKP